MASIRTDVRKDGTQVHRVYFRHQKQQTCLTFEDEALAHVLKDSIVIGSANEPTGWRGGTGGLELLLRDPNGTPHWQAVSGARLSSGMVCQTGHPSAVAHQLHYYRLARAVSATQ